MGDLADQAERLRNSYRDEADVHAMRATRALSFACLFGAIATVPILVPYFDLDNFIGLDASYPGINTPKEIANLTFIGTAITCLIGALIVRNINNNRTSMFSGWAEDWEKRRQFNESKGY